MTELYSIDVRGASADEKEAVAKKLANIVESKLTFTEVFRDESIIYITNFYDYEDEGTNHVMYSSQDDRNNLQNYTDFLGTKKEESSKRIMWNDDVTLTLSAFEIIRLFAASAIQPNCGVHKSLYDYVERLVEDTLPEALYLASESLDFTFINSIVPPSDDQQKQELVDKVFNRDILEQIEKEKEIKKKKEYEDIQSQIKALQAKADKLKEEM